MAKTKDKPKHGQNWVDFRAVKETVTMEMVLDHYNLLADLKKSGANLTGRCPIHKGSNPRQFSVDPARNIFNCFGDCKAGGNVLDFVARMEKVSVREAALLLKGWFAAGPAGAAPEEQAPPEPKPDRKAVPAKAVINPKGISPEGVNPPLDFRLKTLQTDHPFFAERGIAPETVEYFGLGFCSRGLMKNRIVIPIHNEAGELVAYCGRAVTERTKRN